jgi:NSS family neurotransmitter:Na+ symporter
MALKKQSGSRARPKRSRETTVLDGQWGSNAEFVMALTGAAIGFNNVWQFPYLVAQYGGSAFLLVYVLALAVIGIPVFQSEMIIGRRGGESPVAAVRRLVTEDRARPQWQALGWVATIAGFLIFSYLSVIGGWMLAYTVRTVTGGLGGKTLDGVADAFYVFAGDPEKQLFWHGVFLVTVMLVSARGISNGLAPAVRMAVPALFAGLGVLAVYGLLSGQPIAGLSAMFSFNWERLSVHGVLLAMAQAVFSLGIGVGAVIALSAYSSPRAPLLKTAATVAAFDTLAGILAAMFVLSVLAGAGQPPTSGPVLLFQMMPYVLGRLFGGGLIAALMFFVLAVAAWLSALALIESVVAWLRESRHYSRGVSSLIVGGAAWVMGVLVILSFNYWAFGFRYVGLDKKLGMFDVIEILSGEIMLPAAAIAAALFAGWGLKQKSLHAEMRDTDARVFQVWFWLVRVVTPFIILFLFFTLPRLVG